MNAYYERNARVNSNNRNIRDRFNNTISHTQPMREAVDMPLLWLLRMLASLCNPTVCRVVKLVVFASVFVGFIGIIGAMQSGSLGLGTGFLIGCLLLAVEYLCLRSKKATSNR